MTILTNSNTFDKYVKPLSDKLWKLPAYRVTTGNDTEYVQRPNRPNLMLTTQKAFAKDDVRVYEHPSLGLNLAPTWEGKALLSTALGCPEVSVNKPDGYLVEDLMLFFAPADVLAGQFRDFELCRYIQQFIVQDARMRLDTDDKSNRSLLRLPIFLDTPVGVLQYVLGLSDLAKLLGAASLQKTAETFGLSMSAKSLMDDYKTCMDVAYSSTEPYYCDLETRESTSLNQLFIEYSKDDAAILFDIREKALERTQMIYAVHNLQVPSKEYLTTGALIADLGKAYMEAYIGEHKGYELFQKKDAKGKVYPYKLEDLLRRSTVEYFANNKESAKQALALVQGGRAKNERPTVVRLVGAVADNDIKGAYVTLQRLLTYPIGLPRTYGQHESSKKKLTLGQFLKKYGSQLSTRLYALVVTGTLSHYQNLVPSKVVDTFEISEKYNEDDPKIPADFRLFSKEVINGVITSDVLETLESNCTTNEWSSWMNLELVAACWYAPEDRCNSPEEWKARIAAHAAKKGNGIEETIRPDGTKFIEDNRCRAWLAVGLDEYLTPYANKRDSLKNAMKQADGALKQQLDAQQQGMKLVGNVNYGVMASPIFDIGNVVISNVITAACRVAVWAHNMAMGAFQGITDGGAYDLNNVRYWTKNKPGLNTLALWRDQDKLDRMTNRGLATAPLLGRDVISRLSSAPLGIATGNPGRPWTISQSERGSIWSVLSNGEETFELAEDKDGFAPLNQAVKEHVKYFFREPRRGNGISLLDLINYEHKNVYVSAVFQSQTNYLFKHVSGDTKIKARGHKTKGKRYNNDTERSNICQLLEDLLTDPSRIPPYKPQTITQVLKCNQANAMLSSSKDNAVKRFKLLAGDTVLKRSWVRPISLSMFCWQTDAQYQSWNKKAQYLKDKSGWGLEQFFLDSEGYLDYQRAVVEIQDAIDNGLDWIHPVTKGRKVEPIATHPYLDLAASLQDTY